MKKPVFGTIAAFAAAALLTLVLAASPARAERERLRTAPLPEIGCEPPAFTLPTPDGKLADIGAFRGKVILLTFCAGYTDSCCELARALTPLLDSYESQGLVAPLIISEAGLKPAGDRCAGLATTFGDRFLILIDDGKQLKGSYKVRQLPTCFVIGRDFCIRDRVRGEAVFYTAEFKAALEALLAEKP